MCGITGFCNFSGFTVDSAEALIHTMADRLLHRGPDDGGVWLDGDAGIAFGHRRLSILDLSSAGHQPMISTSGRYIIALNGEIYNHLELRAELKELLQSSSYLNDEGFWRGHSDTETLLACFEAWGIETALKRTVGMFAFALWDRQDRVLTLARDRMGEKPLYYGWQGDTFLFGSELKALHVNPAFKGDIDRHVLALYLRQGYISAPYSIYEGIYKLIPGTYLQISAYTTRGVIPDSKAYWSLQGVAESGLATPFKGSEREAIDELEARLMKAISYQCIADVPLGAFLSGGIDSSTIVAFMQAQSTLPIKSFTIGFNEKQFNEAGYAKEVARHLGTDHTELYVTSNELLEVIPKLPILYDEPFGDSSAIPTFLVSQLARQKVTVSLSGDGGDELFGGYKEYIRSQRIWSVMQHIPPAVRHLLADAIGVLSPDTINLFMSPLLSGKNRLSPGDKATTLSMLLGAISEMDFYRTKELQWKKPESVVIQGKESTNHVSDDAKVLLGANLYNHMMYADSMHYLPDDILVKVDRAAMGVSLETRVPMLDHRVIEFAWSLPFHMKVRDNKGKWLLRKVLEKYVPNELIERPKMGFGVPIHEWLRGPLRDWAENLLNMHRLQTDGFFKPEVLLKKWQEHKSNRYNWQHQLWPALMFQAWLHEHS